jgi:hypothetical protein
MHTQPEDKWTVLDAEAPEAPEGYKQVPGYIPSRHLLSASQ